jgi:hypothetical protein
MPGGGAEVRPDRHRASRQDSRDSHHRAEVERAARTGQPVRARDWLREQVQYAAAGAREPQEFLDRPSPVVAETLADGAQSLPRTAAVADRFAACPSHPCRPK